MDIGTQYFLAPITKAQKQYEAIRSFLIDKKSASEVAEKFGYTYRGFTSVVAAFRKRLKDAPDKDPFFTDRKKGRTEYEPKNITKNVIVELRKKNYSIPDIKVILDSMNENVSERTIHSILRKEGFARLPRRDNATKKKLEKPKIKATISTECSLDNEEFSSNAAGIMCFLPYIKKYGLDKLIDNSSYPQTSQISRCSSILSFLALKLSSIKRYSADDIWCMDKGLGLFAKLNVLPKTAWFSSYSHRVTKDMNYNFLKALHKIWEKNELLGDTSNLDFTTIPYWGEDSHLENNWSGKRRQSLSSILTFLAHDPDTGIIDYGDSDIIHKNESSAVLEFLDFYKSNSENTNNLKYLIFDSKFTNYKNLSNLNKKAVKFITIRRRGKNIVKELDAIPKGEWKKIRVKCANSKGRWLKVHEESIKLAGYDGEVRQIAITGHGKIKPALIITNDFDLKTSEVVHKYARRWLVEKAISEQIDFFHLNRVSSSMVIKVDFDLVMTILAHNLYRIFASDLERYSNNSDSKIFEKFISNGGTVSIDDDKIEVSLKKKRNLPLLLEVMKNFEDSKYSFFENKKIHFIGASYS